MTHDELQNNLAAHLRGNTDRMVWTNLQLGPSGSPRPDVFTVNRSFARFRADCYEIKVTVADLRHDLTSGKWQSYRKFGHAVWFAFERGLVPLEIVPKDCGIILRGDGGAWRAARKPVSQVLDTLPRDAWLKLLMDGVKTPIEPQPRDASQWVVARKLAKKMGKEAAQLFDDRHYAKHKFEAATTRLSTEAADIEKAISDRKTAAVATASREAQQLTEALIDFGSCLGLPRDKVNAVTLSRRVRSLNSKFSRYSIDNVIEMLTMVRDGFAVEQTL